MYFAFSYIDLHRRNASGLQWCMLINFRQVNLQLYASRIDFKTLIFMTQFALLSVNVHTGVYACACA